MLCASYPQPLNADICTVHNCYFPSQEIANITFLNLEASGLILISPRTCSSSSSYHPKRWSWWRPLYS